MKVEFKYGLISAVFICIIIILTDTTGLRTGTGGSVLNWISYLVLGFGIYLAIKETRDKRGFITYGQGFRTGMLTTLVAAVVVGIVAYIFYHFIHYASVEMIREKALEKLQERNIPEDQAAAAEKMSRMFTTSGALSFFLFLIYVVAGLILSLIVAAVTRREEHGFGQNDQNGSFNG